MPTDREVVKEKFRQLWERMTETERRAMEGLYMKNDPSTAMEFIRLLAKKYRIGVIPGEEAT